MNDNFVLIDNIYRSRMNLLDILEDRGYNVDKYRKFSPAEATAAITSFPSLSFKVSKNDTKVCDVRYASITRQKLDKFLTPLKHILVPKHEILPQDQHKQLMDSMNITSKSKFPEIKFHIDPIARCIGAVPGDIIKITRPSSSAGESIIYRVCAP